MDFSEGGVMRFGIMVVAILAAIPCAAVAQRRGDSVVALPPPSRDGSVSVERGLSERHSTRQLASDPLTLAEVGQVLWAAQGMNRPGRGRTAPSAGATYPLEVYIVAGGVAGLDPGVYRYRPTEHDLVRVLGADRRAALADSAARQPWLARVPAVLVIAAVYGRTTARYGDRGIRFIHIEAGAAAENVYLQCAALGLGTTYVGAFDDAQVSDVLRLPTGTQPLGLLPVGKLPQ